MAVAIDVLMFQQAMLSGHFLCSCVSASALGVNSAKNTYTASSKGGREDNRVLAYAPSTRLSVPPLRNSYLIISYRLLTWPNSSHEQGVSEFQNLAPHRILQYGFSYCWIAAHSALVPRIGQKRAY